MAKTWTVAEAYNAIKAGDKDGIADFGKRFPLATTALAQAGTNTGLDMFLNALPDRVTMRVVEMSLKEGVQPVEDDDEVEAPAKAEKKEKATKTEKTPAKKGKAKKEEVVEDDEDEDDSVEEIEEEVVEDDEAVDYSSMSVIELFKECKKRKIKVEPKQKASVYIKALEADDKAKAAESDADEDWDDDEEVEEKPSKKSSKASKKSKADDDDDDAWDI